MVIVVLFYVSQYNFIVVVVDLNSVILHEFFGNIDVIFVGLLSLSISYFNRSNITTTFIQDYSHYRFYILIGVTMNYIFHAGFTAIISSLGYGYHEF